MHGEHSRRPERGEGIAHQEVAAPEAAPRLLSGVTRLLTQALQHAIEVGASGGAHRRLQPPVGSAARADLDGVLQRLRQQARDAGKQAGRSLWRRYFLVRDAFASLGPAAVLTVHRSQGSTFGEVFVAGDVFWPEDLVLRRQLVYVAVSRASQAVWLVGDGRGDPADRQRWSALLGEGS